MARFRIRPLMPYIACFTLLFLTLGLLNSSPLATVNVDDVYNLPAGVSRHREINGVLNDDALFGLSNREVSRIYHDYVITPQVKCGDVVRAGNYGDGGWDLCMDPGFKPSAPCLVYSFGINNDFSFDDYIENEYGCEVHAYDPSMDGQEEYVRGKRIHFHKLGLNSSNGVNTLKWKMKSFSEILKVNNHTNTSIDVQKIDIETSELWALPEMLKSGSLRNVKQLVFEIHIKMNLIYELEADKDKYIFGLSLFLDLYKEGFRIFTSHQNKFSKYYSDFGMARTGCHEISMIRRR